MQTTYEATILEDSMAAVDPAVDYGQTEPQTAATATESPARTPFPWGKIAAWSGPAALGLIGLTMQRSAARRSGMARARRRRAMFLRSLGMLALATAGGALALKRRAAPSSEPDEASP